MELTLALTLTRMPSIDIPMLFIEGTPVEQQAALPITEIVLSIFSSSTLEPIQGNFMKKI